MSPNNVNLYPANVSMSTLSLTNLNPISVIALFTAPWCNAILYSASKSDAFIKSLGLSKTDITTKCLSAN